MKIKIFTDGSYNRKTKKIGWAFIILDEYGNILAEECGSSDLECYCSANNVGGEVLAVQRAILFVSEQLLEFIRIEKIELCYDYIGVEMWTTPYKKQWNAETSISKNYKRLCIPIINSFINFGINFSYKKIKSHSSNKWNDYVDRLANAMAFKQ